MRNQYLNNFVEGNLRFNYYSLKSIILNMSIGISKLLQNQLTIDLKIKVFSLHILNS